MSKHELFEAYIAKTINRRTFVQGLTALGVTAGVAASYAVALQPVAAGDGDLYDVPVDDLYDDDLYNDDSGGGGKQRRRRKKKGKGKKKGR